MFIEFRKTLFKMGKFRIKAGFRVKGLGAIFVYLIYLMFYMMWYSLLASLWLMYGFLYLLALPIKAIKHQVDIGRWKKSSVLKVTAIVFGCMIVVGAIGNIAGGNSSHKNVSTNAPAQTEATTTTTTEATNEYAEDDTVNRFITEYNDLSAYTMTDISAGNIRTKYFCKVNGCSVKLLNANGAAAETFNVTIDAENTDADKTKMLNAVKDMFKVFDASLSDEDIDKIISEFSSSELCIKDYSVSEHIVVSYSPPITPTLGKYIYRIDMSVNNYE